MGDSRFAMAHADRSMPVFRFGPVLLFRGEQGSRWRLSALFGVDGEAEPDDLAVAGVHLPVPPRHVTRWRSLNVWRFDFAAPRPPDGDTVAYGFSGHAPWHFKIPAAEAPLALAYVADAAETVRRGGAFPWDGVLAAAVAGKTNLLILGGGQIDAADVWRSVPTLAAWSALDATRREAAVLTPAMAADIFSYYVSRHVAFWSRPDVAAVAASLPLVSTWAAADAGPPHGDTGSVLAQVPRAVVLAARRSFALFQLGGSLEALPECVWGGGGALTQGFRIGTVGMMTLDAGADHTQDDLSRFHTRIADCRHRLVAIAPPAIDAGVMDLIRESIGAGDATTTLLTPADASRCQHPDGRFAVITSSLRQAVVPRRTSWFGERRARRTTTFTGLDPCSSPSLDSPCWTSLRIDGGHIDGAWHSADDTDWPWP